MVERLNNYYRDETVQEADITEERPAQTGYEPATPTVGRVDESRPQPIDPPDNASLPGDPSVTRPDY